MGSTRDLCILVRPGGQQDAVAAAVRCLKRLVPPARVFVAGGPEVDLDCELVVVDAAEIAAGPLAAASALERARTGKGTCSPVPAP